MKRRFSGHWLLSGIVSLAVFCAENCVAQSAPAADSVVAAVAEARGWPRVPPEQWPRFGTFWWAESGLITAPMPCPPGDTNTPVYALGDGQYLVDRGGAVATLAAAEALDAQLNGMLNSTAGIQLNAGLNAAFDLDGGMHLLDSGGGFTPLEMTLFDTNVLWLEVVSVTNPTPLSVTAALNIHMPWPTTNGVYDLYSITNLQPHGNWNWLLRTQPGQTNLVITNLTAPYEFFILGLTNDDDGGSLPSAFEYLVTHGNAFDPSDDLLTPLVAAATSDSVAVEQQPTNTARYVIWRLGGYVGQPLTLACAFSGTASNGTDYSLSPVNVTPTNVLVTIPAGQTNVEWDPLESTCRHASLSIL